MLYSNQVKPDYDLRKATNLRHGLTGQVTVMPGEDREAHDTFCNTLVDGRSASRTASLTSLNEMGSYFRMPELISASTVITGSKLHASNRWPLAPPDMMTTNY